MDEAHHNVATSWQQVKERFPHARIVNFSATPTRADGRLMDGAILYSFPVVRAIQAGYVKRLRAKMLRPSSLRYVERDGGQERMVGPDEVRQLGEDDAAFRRGIVMADETLGSIIDCAIGELRRLRTQTGEQKLKIIASALNQAHCIQITEAFRARGMRADYVHSREGSANEAVFARLENHELDAIVQADEHEERFRIRVGVPSRTDERDEAVMPASKIDGLGGEHHARPDAEGHHPRTSSATTAASCSALSWPRIVMRPRNVSMIVVACSLSSSPTGEFVTGAGAMTTGSKR